MNIAQESRREIRAAFAERSFLAEVADTSGGLIKIKRLGQDTADPAFYPAAAGLAASVSVGDVVKVERVGGVWIVAYEVVTS